MKYIIEGPAIDVVLRENRIRMAKGEIIVTPFVEGAVEDEKTAEVEDTKEVVITDTKKPVKKGKK